jgi:hypothetical protein
MAALRSWYWCTKSFACVAICSSYVYYLNIDMSVLFLSHKMAEVARDCRVRGYDATAGDSVPSLW